MKAEKVINDKKKLIAVILCLILVIGLCAGGIRLHESSRKKKMAEETVTAVMTDLQKDQTGEAEKILGGKLSGKLGIDAMSAKEYMKTIVSALGYTSGNADQDAKASYTDLLKDGKADADLMKNMKKLDQALQKNGITSYEITGMDKNGSEVRVTVAVNGIILLPKVSFVKEVQKANEKLADYVNQNMDDLMRSYNKAYADPDRVADNVIHASLQKEELDELIPAMTRRVEKTRKSEETWTFTVDVSSDQAVIRDVKVQ